MSKKARTVFAAMLGRDCIVQDFGTGWRKCDEPAIATIHMLGISSWRVCQEHLERFKEEPLQKTARIELD